jgi:hypothetical protein
VVFWCFYAACIALGKTTGAASPHSVSVNRQEVDANSAVMLCWCHDEGLARLSVLELN